MKQHIQFVKCQGLGNDFIMIDGISQRINEKELKLEAEKLCDRNFGIGADGLILALPSEESDIQMKVINSDGSVPEMCGNGLRCFAKWVREEGLIEKSLFSVETGAGVRIPALLDKNDSVQMVEVGMGEPSLEPKKIPVKITEKESVVEHIFEVENQQLRGTCVSMGNPHVVIFVDNLKEIELDKLGPAISNHELFPEGVNVEFVQVVQPDEAVMVVWERGAGATLACGTGACAVLVAGVLTKRLERTSTIHLPGGPLKINWQESDNRVVMTGPAETVYRGQFEI